MKHRLDDDPAGPSVPSVSAQGLGAAWLLVGVMALTLAIVSPGPSPHGASSAPPSEAASAGLVRAAALEGFETAGDRAATVARTEDDGVAPASVAPTTPPVAIAPVDGWRSRLRHWIAGIALGAKVCS